jgi:ribose-phosphate pyrophosphokinase
MVRKRKTIAGIRGDDALARSIARLKAWPYVSVELTNYAAGETAARASRAVRGSCVLVRDIEAHPSSVWEAAMAADALKRAGAKRVTLVAPWVAYGRQDRPARFLESCGAAVLAHALDRFDRILTLDAHSRQFIKRFAGRLRSISPAALMARVAIQKEATVIAAPDAGARKRARTVAKILKLPVITCAKKRFKPGISGVRIVCDNKGVEGSRILVVDDMVDSGGTLRQAARDLKRRGAVSVGACVTHAADPNAKPSARDLGLSCLVTLYPRKGKAHKDFIAFIAGAVR